MAVNSLMTKLMQAFGHARIQCARRLGEGRVRCVAAVPLRRFPDRIPARRIGVEMIEGRLDKAILHNNQHDDDSRALVATTSAKQARVFTV
jgi:hypothetical protein